jgi:glycosyltransferase involved in cell wall biosynthesis
MEYVTRGDLFFLLLKAVGLIFVSKLEGYGMPPQEAQALGRPVILSDIPCHRAVYDDPGRWAAVPIELREPPPFVDVNDVQSLASQMQRLLEDSAWRARLAAAGQAYEQTFSAQATGTALHSAFAATLG